MRANTPCRSDTHIHRSLQRVLDVKNPCSNACRNEKPDTEPGSVWVRAATSNFFEVPGLFDDVTLMLGHGEDTTDEPGTGGIRLQYN